MKTLRMLSYNIHKGFSGANQRYLLDEMRTVIRSVNADCVFLQEVVGEHKKRGKHHQQQADAAQFEFLADDIWRHYAYGKNAIYSHGHHGNAILSKYPFSHWKNYNLSRHWFSQRGMLHGRIEQSTHVFCLHLGLFKSERHWQLTRAMAIIKALITADSPLIIAGDFNDWDLSNHTYLMHELNVQEALTETFGQPAKSFPATWPLLRVDRIYYRNLKLLEADCLTSLHWRRLSDHCPLFAEFEC